MSVHSHSRVLAIAGVLFAMRCAAAAPTTDGICRTAQRELAGTPHEMAVVVHPDFESFKQSKAAIRPLTAHQYVEYADGDRSRPARVSCKTKTADLLNETYGAGTANGGKLSCRALNRGTVRAVWRSLTAEERARVTDTPDRIMLDADTRVWTGTQWLREYAYVYRAADGRLHLSAKALRIDWNDWRFAWAPDRLRGVHYCHLVAPEQLRSILLHETRVPKAGAP